MKLYDLPTPALTVDADILENNQAQMNALLHGTPLRLRPHYKSHKCAALARRQLDAGAVGMTCAKLSEAEDLVFSGVEDVLIANQIVEPDKLLRAAQLAAWCRLTVCIDDAQNARALSHAAEFVGSTVHCLVEYDIGMRRCGVRTAEEVLALARLISTLPNLRFDGIQAYAGYASHMVSAGEREAVTLENEKKVAALAALLRGSGLPVHSISGGSTGTAAIKARGGVYTEVQAGSYLFMDSTYEQLGLPFGNSLFVLATVVSRSEDVLILDAGVKGLGADQDDPILLDRCGRRVTGRIELNEEHLKLFSPSAALPIGEKLRIIPGHCCSTVNLYDHLTLFRGEYITERLSVSARGKSQ